MLCNFQTGSILLTISCLNCLLFYSYAPVSTCKPYKHLPVSIGSTVCLISDQLVSLRRLLIVPSLSKLFYVLWYGIAIIYEVPWNSHPVYDTFESPENWLKWDQQGVGGWGWVWIDVIFFSFFLFKPVLDVANATLLTTV